MKGVFYKISDRKIVVEDVPPPLPKDGGVLIKTLYSAISPGTEGATVSLVKGGSLKILKERKEQVMDILRVLGDFGPEFLINKIKSRAEALTPLGYSLCGIVMEDSGDFKKGEIVVAMGGEFANHCEVVWVPYNLVAKAYRRDRVRELSFGAIISVALHALRRSGITGGERAAVIGMGIVGQILSRILKIWDVEVVGVEKDKFRGEVAEKFGIKVYYENPPENIFDVVFVAAPDKTGSVVDMAGRMLRDKGKVVAVADANFAFNWKTYYYKELEILISRSYGAGRYDPDYEVEGRDYPVGYVRWTEKRNLEYAVSLVESGKLNLDDIITHEFPVDDAPAAYELITSKSEPFIGVVLKYPEKTPEERRVYTVKSFRKKGKIGVAFIGAGNYAQGFLIPEIKKVKDVELVAVATLRGHKAKSVAEIFGFKVYTTDYREILSMEEVDVVFVATTHSLHAEITLKAMENNKAVFVEKPLAIREEDLERIKRVLQDKGGYLTVGFNRRFSKHTEFVKRYITRPVQINYLVDAGKIKQDHWIYREGGRLIGEAVHFIDLSVFLAGEIPSGYEVFPSGDGGVVVLFWKDGSVASITYGTLGGRAKKESISVMCSGKTLYIEDFKLSFVNDKKMKSTFIDKGQGNMIKRFFENLREGKVLIPYEEIFFVHKVVMP